jgi:hypothetical protein
VYFEKGMRMLKVWHRVIRNVSDRGVKLMMLYQYPKETRALARKKICINQTVKEAIEF